MWLLLFVAAFQIPDGLQVGTAGALRGFKDAHVPMALNFTAYWLIGFPAAWWFGIRQHFGPSGIWAGLIAGWSLAPLSCSCAIARYRARHSGRRPKDQRVGIGAPEPGRPFSG
jgi:Na+-driven multidrug efflux pump